MAKKKKKENPKLWFENTGAQFEQMRGLEEQFHKQMAQMWSKPMKIRPMKITIRMPKVARLMIGFPIRIKQTRNEILVLAELPGFKKEEIKLNVTSRTVKITAQKKKSIAKKLQTFYSKEMSSNSIQRVLTLPEGVDTESVKAKFENGRLHVILKKTKKKEREIKF